MGLYNFHKRFALFVLRGTKTHTIRALRKYPDKPGNTVHLYTGLRTKKAKLLMRAKCVKVESIIITETHPEPGWIAVSSVLINGIVLSMDERESLACRDGFKDFADMMTFWNGRLPFYGQIIHWHHHRAR